MGNLAILALVPLLFSGCAQFQDSWHTTTVEVKERGDYPNEYIRISKEYFGKTLKDPFSAVYEFNDKPKEDSYRKTFVTQWPTLFNVNGYQTTTIRYSWAVDVLINAKNSYGAYIGWKKYKVHIVNGAVSNAEEE